MYPNRNTSEHLTPSPKDSANCVSSEWSSREKPGTCFCSDPTVFFHNGAASTKPCSHHCMLMSRSLPQYFKRFKSVSQFGIQQIGANWCETAQAKTQKNIFPSTKIDAWFTSNFAFLDKHPQNPAALQLLRAPAQRNFKFSLRHASALSRKQKLSQRPFS